MDDQSTMFENFSEKTKKALRAAEGLAQQLGDQSVATGHLIYGLTVDQSVSLHHIFRDLNVDPDMFAEYVDSLPREPEADRGKPFNRHCHTVFDRARELAEHLGGKEVSPEHLAVATLSVKSGSCYETLKEFSIEPSYVTMLVMESMGLDEDRVPDWF
ncbi:MAG: Clp protease N-terminal domain-containing protein [Planctomycetota bacterium]|jgi:ATP-dependent Clp protease ATP-binding subunit ClpA